MLEVISISFASENRGVKERCKCSAGDVFENPVLCREERSEFLPYERGVELLCDIESFSTSSLLRFATKYYADSGLFFPSGKSRNLWSDVAYFISISELPALFWNFESSEMSKEPPPPNIYFLEHTINWGPVSFFSRILRL